MIVSKDLVLEVYGKFWGGGEGYHTYRNDVFNLAKISRNMTRKDVERVAGDFESVQNFRLMETITTQKQKVLLEE